MSRIYLYEGEFPRGDDGFDMIKAAAELYAKEKDLQYPFAEAQIIREEKGKPYFSNIPIEFSLSHSGILWMCMFADMPCGLDVQEVKECAYEKIADRYYTTREQHYVKLWGLKGFFDIWVRKEALGKCTGRGFFSEPPDLADENHELYSSVLYEGTLYYFTEIIISEDIKCAVCTTRETEIETRVLA